MQAEVLMFTLLANAVPVEHQIKHLKEAIELYESNPSEENEKVVAVVAMMLVEKITNSDKKKNLFDLVKEIYLTWLRKTRT